MRKVPMTIGLLAGAAAATLVAFYGVAGAGKPSDERRGRPAHDLRAPCRFR